MRQWRRRFGYVEQVRSTRTLKALSSEEWRSGASWPIRCCLERALERNDCFEEEWAAIMLEIEQRR